MLTENGELPHRQRGLLSLHRIGFWVFLAAKKQQERMLQALSGTHLYSLA